MKKIGLVGGTGPESTLMYYKQLNSRIDALTGGSAMPDVCIESVNFRRAWQYVVDGDNDSLTDYLSEKVARLVDGGAEVVSLTAATMHIVFADIVRRTGVQLVSIPQTVCGEAVSLGYKRVGLIGTAFTMEKDYMKTDLLNAGIQVFVPTEPDRRHIAQRIFDELEQGIVKDSTRSEFNAIIQSMKSEHGIEAVILGCTELPLLLNTENCVLPCLDSVEIHIRRLIELAMQN